MPAQSVRARLGLEIAGFVDGLDKASRKTKEFADKGESAFKRNRAAFDSMANAAAVGGLALTGVVVGVTKTYADFDEQMSAVAASGSDAKNNIDALRQASIDLGAQTSFSASEAAQGVENLLKAGVSAQDTLGGGLKGALDLAAAGNLSVAESSEIAATAMTQFKLNGSQIPHLADLLAAGAGKAQGEVTDLGQALNQSGLVASGFGLSIEETTGTLSAFAAAGLLGSDAGTSFKTMLLALSNPSTKSAKLMRELGIAAYDVQGNFVGMESLAGQLQARLSGLSQAQRDQALAQIFGNDAVRAARVLYDQGAEGISNWTDDVNDAGFAAETAATRLDNLKGDLEGFMGALESAALGTGGANDGFLRGIVQDATGVVEAFNKIPTPVKETGLSLAGLAGASALGFAGVTKGLGTVIDLRENLNSLAATSPRVAAGITRFGKAAGGAAVGVGALMVAAQVSNSLMDTANISGIEASTNAVLALGKAGDTAAVSGLFTTKQSFVARNGELVTGVNDVNSALTRLFDKNAGDKFNDFAEGMLRWTGASTAVDRLTGAFGEVDASLVALASNGSADEAASAFRKIQESAAGTTATTQQLVDLFPKYRDELTAQANALKITNLTAEEYADWMGGKIPPRVKAAADAAKTAGADTSKFSDALGGTTKTADELAKELQELVDKFTILNDGALSQERANIAWQESLDDVSESVKANQKAGLEHAASLNINTEAGRNNRTALIGQFEALNDSVTATFKRVEADKGAKAAQKAATAEYEAGRKKILENADAANVNRDAVKKLGDQVLNSPKKLSIPTDAPGVATTKQKIEALDAAIRAIDGKTVTIGANIHVSKDGKSFTVGSGPTAKTGSAYATGGAVRGPGTGTSDDIPAWLSNGEFVLREKAVQKIGVDRLNWMNQHGTVPMFASGGLVSRDLILNGRIGQVPSVKDALQQAASSELAAWARANTKAIMASGLVGGGGFAKALEWARAQAGKPYVWGGVGPGGYDCSGFMSAIQNVIGGKNPYSRLWATGAFNGQAKAAGLTRDKQSPFMVGITNAGVGHTAGTLNGVNVESRGGDGVVVGPSARGYKNGLFGMHYGYAAGGLVGNAPFDVLDPRGRYFDEKLAKLLDRPGFADGGWVRGAGSGTSDSIIARLSNGEFVLRERAASALGPAALASLNALGGGSSITGAPGFANGGLIYGRPDRNIDMGAIERLIRAVVDPIKRIADATKRRDSAQSAYNRAIRSAAPEKRTLDRAKDRYDDARDKRDKERARNAAQVAKQEKIVAALKKGSNAREAAQDRLTAMRKANTAEMAKLNAKVTETSKAKTKAQEAYNKAAASAKEKADQLREAERALADANSALAESANQTADAFSGLYESKSTDPRDWIAKQKEGAADLARFTAQIEKLRKAGLSEDAIAQIVALGQEKGTAYAGEVANNILAGGKGTVNELNKSIANLANAAQALGVAVNVAPKKAGGGLIVGPGTGTSDSVLARLSNGEFVMNARATAANLPMLRALNEGRVYARSYASPSRAAHGGSQGDVVGQIAAALESMRVMVPNPFTGQEVETRMQVSAQRVVNQSARRVAGSRS